jgi:hypothetical protein
MQSSKVLRFAGDVSIDKVTIVTSQGVSQNITAQVINVQFYEDLFSPFITGSLIVKESLDLVNLLPFAGEEMVELEITTPSLEKKPIKGKYYIYKLTNRELVGERSVVYQLHFISPEAIVDLNKKSSKVFAGKISDLVSKFITDKNVGLESTKNLYAEPTSNTIKYISNYWNASQNIQYLTDHAANEAKVPNYVFFENRDGFYFISLDKLYTADNYQSFVYDKYTRDDRNGGGSIRNITEDYKRISTISIPTGFDYMDRITNGMLSSRAFSYDVTKKTYTAKSYNMFAKFDKQQHLNEYPVSSDKAIFKSNATLMSVPRNYGNFNGFGDVTNFKTIQERTSLMKLAEASKIEITVPGRTDYTVGQKVSVTLNKIEPIKSKESNEDVKDKMFSGYYLIAAINHYVDRNKHECHIELIKDTLLINLNGSKK